MEAAREMVGYAPLSAAGLDEAFWATPTRPVPGGGGLLLVGWVEPFAKPIACRASRTAADGFRKSSTHPTDRKMHMKKPGAVSRPGTLREFQFPE